jgi:hypothetical protein
MEEECPICLENLTDTLTTLGCCQKTFHLQCIVKCLKSKLECPMCRAHHVNLNIVQDVESQVMVPVRIYYSDKNKNVFKNFFLGTIVVTVMIISIRQFQV